MAVSVIVGAQWGDEGKGKMADYLARQADLVVRFQGGDNAGHTVVNEYGSFKLHIVPCGIFNPAAMCLVGTGTVVNPDVLLEEMAGLSGAGVDTGNLKVSNKAHILMPYHVELDQLAEKRAALGTTQRGIGPAYAGRALRQNLRFEDLLDPNCCRDRISSALPEINDRLSALGGRRHSTEECMGWLRRWADAILGMLVDPVPFVHSYLRQDRHILFEGQLGAMKDIDLGIYPYVTSSHPLAAYAAVTAGIPASSLTNVIGVAKAFSSAVGSGPMPAEMDEVSAAMLRGTGEHVDDEYGARTGRARRLGWFDLPVVKYAHSINGFTELALCKLDKLDSLPEISICSAYELDGRVIDHMPGARELYRVKPIYTKLPGWRQSTRGVREISRLPANARAYLRFIEEALGVPIKYVGTGPAREEVAIAPSASCDTPA